MSKNLSKNDKAWLKIFQAENITEHIKKHGIFQISSSRINQEREARLMTKFDHYGQLPKIFKKNNLTIQPTERGKYIIGTFDSYFSLPEKSSTEIIYRELPDSITTLDSTNIYSEASAILCAFYLKMIDDVVEEETAFTILGRMSTGEFEYQIQDNNTNKNHTINVINSQCEIDGGFESENKLAIIEAKSETVNDFIIRQLYYPYRLWTSKTNKDVIPIFLTISNDIFSFYRFEFTDNQLYNSLKLVSEHKYCISKSDIDICDIREILKTTKIVKEPEKIPFPQADIFTRIVDLLGRLYDANKPLTKDEITLIYAFDERQTNYYVAAARYLELVDRKHIKNQNVTFSLSQKGKWIMAQHPQKRNLQLAKCILSHKSFNQLLNVCLEQAQIPALKDIVKIMENESQKYSFSTLERRARTVKGWINWILELTR